MYTNADKIRSMSDEEMSNYLLDFALNILNAIEYDTDDIDEDEELDVIYDYLTREVYDREKLYS